jgi:hypothetical protein
MRKLFAMMGGRGSLVGVLVAAGICLLASAGGRPGKIDLARVPGVVVHRLPVPSPWQRLAGRAIYTASPSIAVLPDGSYVITDNLFGKGSGADSSGTTQVFGSSDRGEHWHLLTVIPGMKRGSLFVHGQALFLLGYRAAPGDIVIRRSDDGGRTWTEPEDEASGLLRRGNFGGTPQRPVVYGGRIWLAQAGRRVLSAAVGSDLLRADSWALSRRANTSSGPFGKDATITEGQVVASPATGVVVMPKIGGEPFTVLLRVGREPETLRDPRREDWVALPGGEKKFALGFDPQSGYFFALSNPVMPRYRDSGWPPELIRNVAALLVSRDLREWRIALIFLETPRVDHEAFQYFSYDFDGEDLVIASRTAFEVGDGKPPRGHDSNLTTFHRIENFRSYFEQDGEDVGESETSSRKICSRPAPLSEACPWSSAIVPSAASLPRCMIPTRSATSWAR